MSDDAPGIDCRTAVQQLWDYLDEELDDARMAAVRRHLHECRSCLPHHDFGRQFLEALRSAREMKLMPPEVRIRVMQRLVEAGFRAE